MRLIGHILIAALWVVMNVEGTVSKQVSKQVGEYGSYANPNARAFDKCTAQELIKLSQCCNDVLVKLNTCKAEDLACECCALQSIDKDCYNLCPGNPSVNFLTVLINDCSSLQGVNACGLPFKKYNDPIQVDPLMVSGKSLLQTSSSITTIPTPTSTISSSAPNQDTTTVALQNSTVATNDTTVSSTGSTTASSSKVGVASSNLNHVVSLNYFDIVVFGMVIFWYYI
ncbi:uncharacterized protein KQ657_003062 [Scheffersomyces spartinae]|uniref:Uncharacterized protein n=1 Tax=Scheffersomyces spartinae TaxID=45513 RepID=A0A9P7V555_9ASCO|nr:uncharacterized protein KQ657_003062 [Scheffersomyces spartinae]KAG7191556.1 hypothetical protein KQ657_003062 [Scheffersomyces spartinae]